MKTHLEKVEKTLKDDFSPLTKSEMSFILTVNGTQQLNERSLRKLNKGYCIAGIQLTNLHQLLPTTVESQSGKADGVVSHNVHVVTKYPSK